MGKEDDCTKEVDCKYHTSSGTYYTKEFDLHQMQKQFQRRSWRETRWQHNNWVSWLRRSWIIRYAVCIQKAANIIGFGCVYCVDDSSMIAVPKHKPSRQVLAFLREDCQVSRKKRENFLERRIGENGSESVSRALKRREMFTHSSLSYYSPFPYHATHNNMTREREFIEID